MPLSGSMYKNRIEFAGDVFYTEERDGKVKIHIKAVGGYEIRIQAEFRGSLLDRARKIKVGDNIFVEGSLAIDEKIVPGGNKTYKTKILGKELEVIKV